MITKKITKTEHFSQNSKKFPVEPNKKYRFRTIIVGRQGKPFSALVSIILLNHKDSEITRFIRWINDFSGKENEYTIVFSTMENAKNAIVGYRFNKETLVSSDLDISFVDASSLKLEPIEDDVENSFDSYESPPMSSLTEKEENILEQNMVWIFGTPRSGSTWLCTQLLKNKEIKIWDEPWIGHNLAYIRSFGIQEGHWNEFSGYFFSQKYKKNSWLPALRKFILTRAYSETLNLRDKIIIKEPNGSNGADIIMECLPNSKLIFLLRDGRDVVDSMIDAYSENSWNVNLKPFSTKKERFERIKQVSQMWQRFTKLVWDTFQLHNPNLRLLVKYEDLKKDTFTELKKIYEFLEIQINDDDLQSIIEKYDFKNIPDSEKGRGKFVRSANPGGWKENFNKEEKEIMNSTISINLEKFRYDV